MLSVVVATLIAFQQPPAPTPITARLQVFLDCNRCFADYLREETQFVDFVRDRSEADVHVIITSVETGSGGREYVLAFTGGRSYADNIQTLKAITGTGEPEEIRRQQVVTTLRIGLLQYIAAGGAPPQLEVNVALAAAAAGEVAPRRDRWNSWVFSLRGSASASGEESSRENEFSGSLSADRITPNWKLTFGTEFDRETEEFDLDEDDPVRVSRREGEFNWLVVKSLGDHWSAGATGEVRTSTTSRSHASRLTVSSPGGSCAVCRSRPKETLLASAIRYRSAAWSDPRRDSLETARAAERL